MNLKNMINEAYEYIKQRSNYNPEIGIVLGTGLGEFAQKVENAEYYKYSDIPNFPVTSIDGHEGTLVVGKLNGKEVIIMKGRVHYYEGCSPQLITLPIRVMKLLGVKNIIITNCGGQANENIEAGDLFMISNHINLSGMNPLIGQNLETFGERFPDLAFPYDKEMRREIREISQEIGINVKEGVYAMFSGPSYETATETVMAARLGADIVGMSTVPEVIIANHCKMKVLAFSGIPCLAAAYSDSEITHEDVIKNCKIIADKCTVIIDEFIKRM